jgi:hypothetical protein
MRMAAPHAPQRRTTGSMARLSGIHLKKFGEWIF